MQSEYRPWKKEKKIRRHHLQHGIYFELFSAPLAETRIISAAAAVAGRGLAAAWTLKTRLLAPKGTDISDKRTHADDAKGKRAEKRNTRR